MVGAAAEKMTMTKIYDPSRLGVSEDAIAQRAYELWCERGCPEGGDGREDWDAAVAELTVTAQLSGQHRRGPLLRLWSRIRSRAAM